MQLSVFSTDNQKSGFRLQYMEVFNWGTFDETIHSIHPMGETSLLTGANGSGKTTFVDALLTLIVPEKRYRFYNQSSGSEKKGDRTEETYVLGGYGSINSESTGATKTLYLRENKEVAYSIILANFANEAEQTVTLFQVRYFSNNELKKVFGVAHKALKIEDDFKPFDLGGAWKKTIDQRYNKGARKFVEFFDAASKYAIRLVEVLGMQSIQALHLFNQTVGIKVLGNLDEFIRTHMLEPRNMEEQFQDLKKHLSTLLDARRNIEKSEEQLAMLLPVKEQYEKFHQSQQELEQLTEVRETARVWHRYKQSELLQEETARLTQAIRDLEQKKEVKKVELDKVQEDERNLLNQVEQNKAGQRMQQLEKEQKELVEKREQAAAQLAEFTAWCRTLHLSDVQPDDESSFQRLRKENDKVSHTLEREQRLNEDDLYDAKRLMDQNLAEKASIESELNNILSTRNNIPSYLIEVRKKICDGLDIESSDLPFAGELMQVKSSEIHWQPAMEKLLRNFAMRLLVPDKYYKKVNKYLNKENIRARLVYEHVIEKVVFQHPEKGTVHEKLEFHPDHKLTDWLEQQIIHQFNYMCLDDEKTLDRFEKAITLHGLTKSGRRHEKDDRPDTNDASRYVMGWDNERKKQALFKKRDKLSDQIEQTKEVLTRCTNKSKRLQEQFYANQRIKEYPGFDGIDVGGLQQKIRKIEDQVKNLTKESKALAQLKKDLDQKATAKEELQETINKIVGDIAVTESQLVGFKERLKGLSAILSTLTEKDKDALLVFQSKYAADFDNISLANLDTVHANFDQQQQQRFEKLRVVLSESEKTLTRALYRIKNPSAELARKYPDWNGDVVNLPEEVKYANEYIEWMNKLQTENLPKYKKDFENYINVTITYKIGGLNEELEKWEREIHNSIIKLNQSLAGINFNRMPDTYVQLRKQPVPAGTEIRKFKTQLLEALPQAANWQQSSFEEKAQHFTEKIQPVINELEENESYRNKVLDVRNWFEFWADEKYRNTDELKKTYRQMGQLSGGEKAQLTYTILCSAIAYQFGITKEGKNSRSLRFVAVDESFSNQDEEKATYLMELCKQLHLQLLVVTPSDKIQIVQEFIAHVHLVQRVANRNSVVYNMTVKQLKEKMTEVEELVG